MSGKEIIGVLYDIFPSDARKKRWQDKDEDVEKKAIRYVQREVKHLLKRNHFLNAVDEKEPVRPVSSLFVWICSYESKGPRWQDPL